MNWKEVESNAEGQLDLPGFVRTPYLAERIFVSLCGKWQTIARATPDQKPMPREADLYSLACLLVATEWGSKIGRMGWNMAWDNIRWGRRRRENSWYETLTWQLCHSACRGFPGNSDGEEELNANLNHHNSSLRTWVMETAWFAFPALDVTVALPALLGNIANTLLGVEMAAGLAVRFYKGMDEFLNSARAYRPPENFVKQYNDRIIQIQELGTTNVQVVYWETEALCRRMVEEAAMSLRLAPAEWYTLCWGQVLNAEVD